MRFLKAENQSGPEYPYPFHQLVCCNKVMLFLITCDHYFVNSLFFQKTFFIYTVKLVACVVITFYFVTFYSAICVVFFCISFCVLSFSSIWKQKKNPKRFRRFRSLLNHCGHLAVKMALNMNG